MLKISDILGKISRLDFWKKHASSIFLCLLNASILFGCISLLRNHARDNNVRLLEDMGSTWVSDVWPTWYSPQDPLLQEAFSSVADATQRNHPGRDVQRMKKHLEIDDRIVNGLNFQSADDLVLVLYTLRNQDEDMKLLVNEADQWRGLKDVRSYYRFAAIRSFIEGNYFLAYSLTQHYFNQYVLKESFDREGGNNNMHILRLLTTYRWELTTNRTFAKQFNEFIYGSEEQALTTWTHLEDYCKGNEHLRPLCQYFKALTLYHLDLFTESIQLFQQCAVSTDDELLKQYCAFMCVRAAFWRFDKDRTKSNYQFFHIISNQNAHHISLPYFASDIAEYKAAVEQIYHCKD